MPERRVHAQCSSASARVSSSQTEPGQRSYRTECGDGAPKPDTLEGHLEGCHVSVSRWASGGSRARPRLEEGDGWGRPRQGPRGSLRLVVPPEPPETPHLSATHHPLQARPSSWVSCGSDALALAGLGPQPEAARARASGP